MADERRLIELIEQAGDMALSKHIPLTADMIAKHLIRNGVEIPVRCKDCYWNDRDGRCMNPKCGKSWYGCPVPDDHYCSYGERRCT